MDQRDEDSRLAALARIKARQDAYRNVFGLPGERTAFQIEVLADIERFTKFGEELVSFDREGRIDPNTVVYRAGKEAVTKRIHKMIQWSDTDEHTEPST